MVVLNGRGWGLGQGTLYVELVAQRVVLYLQSLEDLLRRIHQ